MNYKHIAWILSFCLIVQPLCAATFDVTPKPGEGGPLQHSIHLREQAFLSPIANVLQPFSHRMKTKMSRTVSSFPLFLVMTNGAFSKHSFLSWVMLSLPLFGAALELSGTTTTTNLTPQRNARPYTRVVNGIDSASISNTLIASVTEIENELLERKYKKEGAGKVLSWEKPYLPLVESLRTQSDELNKHFLLSTAQMENRDWWVQLFKILLSIRSIQRQIHTIPVDPQDESHIEYQQRVAIHFSTMNGTLLPLAIAALHESNFISDMFVSPVNGFGISVFALQKHKKTTTYDSIFQEMDRLNSALTTTTQSMNQLFLNPNRHSLVEQMRLFREYHKNLLALHDELRTFLTRGLPPSHTKIYKYLSPFAELILPKLEQGLHEMDELIFTEPMSSPRQDPALTTSENLIKGYLFMSQNPSWGGADWKSLTPEEKLKRVSVRYAPLAEWAEFSWRPFLAPLNVYHQKIQQRFLKEHDPMSSLSQITQWTALSGLFSGIAAGFTTWSFLQFFDFPVEPIIPTLIASLFVGLVTPTLIHSKLNQQKEISVTLSQKAYLLALDLRYGWTSFPITEEQFERYVLALQGNGRSLSSDHQKISNVLRKRGYADLSIPFLYAALQKLKQNRYTIQVFPSNEVHFSREQDLGQILEKNQDFMEDHLSRHIQNGLPHTGPGAYTYMDIDVSANGTFHLTNGISKGNRLRLGAKTKLDAYGPAYVYDLIDARPFPLAALHVIELTIQRAQDSAIWINPVVTHPTGALHETDIQPQLMMSQVPASKQISKLPLNPKMKLAQTYFVPLIETGMIYYSLWYLEDLGLARLVAVPFVFAGFHFFKRYSQFKEKFGRATVAIDLWAEFVRSFGSDFRYYLQMGMVFTLPFVFPFYTNENTLLDAFIASSLPHIINQLAFYHRLYQESHPTYPLPIWVEWVGKVGLGFRLGSIVPSIKPENLNLFFAAA